MTEVPQASPLAQPQNLDKQTLDGIKGAAPKLTDAAVITLLIGGKHSEGQVLVVGALDLAGGDDGHAIGVQDSSVIMRGSNRFYPLGSLA